jgi:hypothetical protein
MLSHHPQPDRASSLSIGVPHPSLPPTHPRFPGFFLRLYADDVLTLGLAEADVRGRGGEVDEEGGDEDAGTANDAEEGTPIGLGERGREGGREGERWRRSDE